MSNHYFRFRQFQINQDRCAMKVSTDACIQGAWTPIRPGTKNVLDIGCGTGLLSLMLTQRDPSLQTDALELDRDAAAQAAENIAASPWAEQIKVFHTDARSFPFGSQYDLIICNPPFFRNSLLGAKSNRNTARHDLSLTLGALFEIVSCQLHVVGQCSVMLPPAEHGSWERLLKARGWHFHRILSVKPAKDKELNRIISLAGPAPADQPVAETLVIYQSGGGYTDQFTWLMRQFYLNL